MLELRLEAFRSQKAILRALISGKTPRADHKSDDLEILIYGMTEVERQVSEIQARDDSRDRKKAAMDSIQKFLDIARNMNPQI